MIEDEETAQQAPTVVVTSAMGASNGNTPTVNGSPKQATLQPTLKKQRTLFGLVPADCLPAVVYTCSGYADCVFLLPISDAPWASDAFTTTQLVSIRVLFYFLLSIFGLRK